MAGVHLRMNPSQFLALDVGMKRTGIARASAIAKLPEPLMSVDTDNIIDCLNKLISEYSVDAIVIGLPRSLNGDDTDQTKWVREWTKNLKNQINLPLYWQDEALTTKVAEEWMKNSKTGHDIDAHAAAAILDDFLKSRPEERVLC